MTVETTQSRVSYTGSGITGPFTIPFYFIANADIRAIVVTIATGVESELALTTGFTLTGAGEEAGGTLTLVTAISSSFRLVIFRDPSLLQEADYPANDAFPSETHERVADKGMMVGQRNRDLINRSLRQPDGDSANIGTIPAAVNRALKALTFDANGEPIAQSAVPTSGVLATALWETILDDATRAASHNSLGISRAIVRMAYMDGAWKVFAPDGTPVSTASTTTSGLQEAINYAQTNGYSLEVTGPSITAAGVEAPRIDCTTGVSIGPATYTNYIFKGCVIRWDAFSGNCITFDVLDNCTVDMDCTLQRSGGSSGQSLVVFQPTTDEPRVGGLQFQQNEIFIRHLLQYNSGSPRSMVTFAPQQDRGIINNRFRFGGIDGGTFVNNCIQVDNPIMGGADLSAFNDNDISWHILGNWKDDALVIGSSGLAANAPLGANKWAGSIESTDATADNMIRTFGFLDTFFITSMDINTGTCTNGINFAGSSATDNFAIIPQIVATTNQVVDSGSRNTVFHDSLWRMGGGQLKFPATAIPSTDANTLDDYEEGTWTPIIGGSATYTTQAGTYTKVGRGVDVGGRLTINAVGTGSTGTISGLPFAAASATFCCTVGFWNGSATNYTSVSAIFNASTIQLTGIAAAGAGMTLPAVFFANSADVIFGGTYNV